MRAGGEHDGGDGENEKADGIHIVRRLAKKPTLTSAAAALLKAHSGSGVPPLETR